MSNILENALKDGKQILKTAGISSWALDADVLMAHATKMRREELITNNRYNLPFEELEAFQSFIERRRKLSPIAYITNHIEFMGLDFFVNENVLIPRPDTEILVEAVIKHINESGTEVVLDMCTGSGAIAISIAHYCPKVKVTAVDISQEALEIARLNSEKNNVRIDFIESDMFESVKSSFDIIVSNPPYVSKSEMSLLEANVYDYEPHMALCGGQDGLSYYKILAKARTYLCPEAIMCVEIGAYQKDDVIDIFKEEDFHLKSSLKDLAGLDRVLIFSENRG